MKFVHTSFFVQWRSQETADLVTFTEEIRNVKLHFLCCEKRKKTHKFRIYRSSYQSCSARKVVLRNFKKFTGKHLCQSPFFIEISQNSLENTCARFSCLINLRNFIKKETLVQVFSCQFCEISKNISLTETSWRLFLYVIVWEHLDVTWLRTLYSLRCPISNIYSANFSIKKQMYKTIERWNCCC